MPVENSASRKIKGQVFDVHPSMLDETSYAFALNAAVEGLDGNGFPIVQNDSSNKLCHNFPADYKVVGRVVIPEQSRIIWMLKNDITGMSQIGESMYFSDCYKETPDGISNCDDCGSVNLSENKPLETTTQSPCCEYFPINSRECFNFNRKHPINSIEYRIVPCGIQIFFTDFFNGRRWLELEYATGMPTDRLVVKKEFLEITGYEDEPCEIPVYSQNIDCNKINIHPIVDTPYIEFVDLVSGGSNKSGSYQFAISFADIEGNKLSSYVSSTNIIPIRTRDITFETDYLTDRAIALSIKGIDPFGPYQYYNLIVIKTINNVTSFYKAGTYPITKTSVVYTGNEESEIRLTPGEIFQRNPFYDKAKSVTSSNNILFWANLKEFPKLNLQQVANKVAVGWQTTAIPESVYRDPRNVNKFKSLMRDEVYAIGMNFIMDTGEEFTGFHIPGRPPVASDLEIVNNHDVIEDDSCVVDDSCVQLEVDPGDLNPDNPVVGPGIPLTLENTGQAVSCTYTPYVEAPIVSNSAVPTITTTTPVAISGSSPFTLSAVILGGEPMTMVWKQLTGPNQAEVIMEEFDLATNTKRATISNCINGAYTFQIYAYEFGNPTNVNEATVTVNVTTPANIPPIANAGADKVVYLPDSSFLTADDSSDPDGTVVSFKWSQVSGPSPATITSDTESFTTVLGLAIGTYEFKVEVTDNTGCVSEATTLMYVLPDPLTVLPGCSTLRFPQNGETVKKESVELDWDEVPGATSYDVYLGIGVVPVFALIGNTVNTSFTPVGLSDNTVYSWYVTPKNSIGNAVGCVDFYKTFITKCVPVFTAGSSERYKVYNTATLDGGALEVYRECDETCYQFGKFGYWQSIEKYPNIPAVWGDLCGQPVRHHRVPDSTITHIHDREGAANDFSKDNMVYPIGIKVDHQSVKDAIAEAVTEGVLTQEQADKIVGYRIIRGNRFQNKSIVAKGLIFDVNNYRRRGKTEYLDSSEVYFPNYPYNDLRANPFLTNDIKNYEIHNRPQGPDLPFNFSKRYTFHSPDIHFNNPSLGTELKLETVEYGQSEGYFTKSNQQPKQKFLSDKAYNLAVTIGIIGTAEKNLSPIGILKNILSGSIVSTVTNALVYLLEQTNIILELIKSLTPFRDWSIQYNSVGKYNAYSVVPNNVGFKRRRILKASYLNSENTLISEEVDASNDQLQSVRFNNFNRESSVYIKHTGNSLNKPEVYSGVIDNSRQLLSSPLFGCELEQRRLTDISAYYASIKNFVPDQYGSIYDIEYVSTDSQVFDLAEDDYPCKTVFGGDTFITRFALKTKLPYFLATPFALPAGTDFNFALYGNVAFPRFYYDSTTSVGSEIDELKDIFRITTREGRATFLGRPKSISDCRRDTFFYQNGYIYLYHYGIPNFLVESDINTDMRHGENLREKAYYPAQGDLDFWLQEENVPIKEDNYYFYNNAFSKQNKENPIIVRGPEFDPEKECKFRRENRVIYSPENNWIVNLANDFYDVPLTKGPITSVEGIENDTVLIRTENSTSIFKAFNLIPIDGNTVQVGTGGIFKNKPQDFAETPLGYVGSQHQAILHTEYGHIIADAKRGQVFNIAPNASGVDEISKDGMKNWFKENLPFRILRDFRNMPEEHIDNAYAAAGISMAFDKRFNRFFITKKDWKLKDSSVLYNPDTREFYRQVGPTQVIVEIGDPRYFIDCSWTISYNFFLKSWVSFHSFTPNFYVEFIDFFGTGLSDSMWMHNISDRSNQVYYGKLYPFITEVVAKFKGPLYTLIGVQFDSEVRRYSSEFDYSVKHDVPGFNKAVVYNDHYNSGTLELVNTPKGNLNNIGKYPIRKFNGWDIEVGTSNYKWRFNQFYDLTRKNTDLNFWKNRGNNAEKDINNQAFNYHTSDFDLNRIKGNWFKIRLINDKFSNYKILHKFVEYSQIIDS